MNGFYIKVIARQMNNTDRIIISYCDTFNTDKLEPQGTRQMQKDANKYNL